MKQGVLVLLAICSIASAMVVNNKTAVCAPQTPCAWSVYNQHIRIVEATISNNYCVCGENLKCKVDEDDKTSSMYVHRCRKPDTNSETPES